MFTEEVKKLNKKNELSENVFNLLDISNSFGKSENICILLVK